MRIPLTCWNLSFCRTRKYRERHVAESKTGPGIQTQNQRKKQRERWREQKRKWRSGLGSQKKRRIREREARMRVIRKRMAASRLETEKQRKMKQNIKKRTKQNISVLLKEALAHKSWRTLQERVQRRRLVATLLPAYRSVREASRGLGVRLNLLQKMTTRPDKKARYDANISRVKSTVHSFYKEEVVSTALGGTRGVTRDGNTVRYLQQTLKETYRHFLEQQHDFTLGYSTFAKLRPKDVKLFGTIPKNQALCERCANMDIIIDVLKTVYKSANLLVPEFLMSKQALVDCTLCPTKSRYHNHACIKRECAKCGTRNLKDNLLKDVKQDDQVGWRKWENVDTEEEKKHMALVEKTSSVSDLIVQLCNDLDESAEHLFNARWQKSQYNGHLADIGSSPGKLLQVMDFAQNYLCLFQDEAQSAHWAHEQVTIHPIVNFYSCVCKDVIREECVVISDDLKHDSHAVAAFEKVVDYHLKTVRNLDVVDKNQYTDGAASQYKGVTAFAYVADQGSTGCRVTRNFFGSRHGKGPCDPVGGVVKNVARRAVMSRKAVIKDANDMFVFCTSNLTVDNGSSSTTCTGKHMRRSFFYVASSDVNHIKRTDLVTVKGTRKIHCVRSTNDREMIETRNLSCSCKDCEQSLPECENPSYVGVFKTASITKKRKLPNEGIQEKEKPRKRRRQENLTPRPSPKTDAPRKRTLRAKMLVEPSTSPVSDPDYVPHTIEKRPRRETSKSSPPRPTPKKRTVRSKACKADVQDIKNIERGKQKKQRGTRPRQTLQEQKPNTRTRTVRAEISKKTLSDEKRKKEEKVALRNPLKSKTPSFLSQSILAQKLQIDVLSVPLVPDDIPLQGTSPLFPVKIYGDGNCLPRCASLGMHGTQERHKELRDSVVQELVKNKEWYLSNDYMRLGGTARSPVKDFASFSNAYLDEHLNENNIRKIYEEEIKMVRKPNAYMGVWQLASLANIMSRPIVSVYGHYGSKTVRPYLH